MKYSICAIAVFCMLAIVSCREKPASGPAVLNRQLTLPTGSPSTTPANPVLPGTTPIVASSGSAKINPAHGQPGHRCDIAVGAPLPATAQAANPTSGTLNTAANQPAALTANNSSANAPANGLNPAHGQPGHRCDIAVGAPLNSQPAAKTTTPSVSSVSKPAVLQPDTLFAKGLNPAHGQPGHRCDIAVGKPLSEAKKSETPTSIPLTPAGN